MTFNAHLYTGTRGCYAAALVDPIFVPWIDLLRDALSLPDNTELEPHCTIVYSKSATLKELVKLPNEAVGYAVGIEAVIGHKGLLVVMLKIDCPEIVSAHEALKAAGAEHSYPEFKAHITLSADLPAESPAIVSRCEHMDIAFKRNPVPLLFSHFYIEDVS